jgi:hypothetical protein
MMFVILIACFIVLFILRFIKEVGKSFESWMNFYIKIMNMIFYNFFMRYALQSTLKLQYAAGEQIGTSPVEDDFLDSVKRWLSMTILITFTGILPILFLLILCANRENLSD